MDMPSSCDMCDLIEMVNGKMYCGVKGCGQCAEDYIVCRPDWCPLKPMPEKKETPDNILGVFMNIGRSACIDEILGDKE